MDPRCYTSPAHASRALKGSVRTVLFRGDCRKLISNLPDACIDLTITSPPYCLGKEYEKARTVQEFIEDQRRVLPEIARLTKVGGSICWQVGYHTVSNEAFPLDYAVFTILSGIKGISLRNRLIWSFGHGLHQRRRFSGRHEIVLWFTKGKDYYFDLEAVRVPQKYPGKRHHKGPQKGEFSGNPRGKNPGDVWEIPNVKAFHVEKLAHPCQFPVGLVDRLVRALCPKGGTVFDPYMGSGSTGVAAAMHNARFIGAESMEDYFTIARKRLAGAHKGVITFRSADRPIHSASPTDSVARTPDHFVGGKDETA